MSYLKEQLIKLGSANKELRPHIQKVLASTRVKTSSLAPLKEVMDRLGRKWTVSRKKIKNMMGEINDEALQELHQASLESIEAYSDTQWKPKGYKHAKRYRGYCEDELERRAKEAETERLSQSAELIAEDVEYIRKWKPRKADIVQAGGLKVAVSALIPVWDKIQGVAHFVRDPKLEILMRTYNQSELDRVASTLDKAAGWLGGDENQKLLEELADIFENASLERRRANNAFPNAYDHVFEDEKTFYKWLKMNQRSILQGDRGIKEWGLERQPKPSNTTVRFRDWTVDEPRFDQDMHLVPKIEKKIEKVTKRMIDKFPDALKDNLASVSDVRWGGDKNYFYVDLKFNNPGRVY